MIGATMVNVGLNKNERSRSRDSGNGSKHRSSDGIQGLTGLSTAADKQCGRWVKLVDAADGDGTAVLDLDPA
jgi:hypothetical protein